MSGRVSTLATATGLPLGVNFPDPSVLEARPRASLSRDRSASAILRHQIKVA